MNRADSLAKHPLVFIVQKFFSTGMPEPSQGGHRGHAHGGGAMAARCDQLFRLRAAGQSHDGRVPDVGILVVVALEECNQVGGRFGAARLAKRHRRVKPHPGALVVKQVHQPGRG